MPHVHVSVYVYVDSPVSCASQTASSGREDGDLDWQDFAIEGTSQALEKPYLRLTSAPDPSAVRPEPVLRRSLAHVTSCWHKKRDYHFACEQLKSIRQDLTVSDMTSLPRVMSCDSGCATPSVASVSPDPGHPQAVHCGGVRDACQDSPGECEWLSGTGVCSNCVASGDCCVQGDRGEFNQCQAQLKALYLEGIAGQQAEFVAYRILYLIMTHNFAGDRL